MADTLLVSALRSYQRRTGLSHRALAAALGLHPNGLAKILRGAATPRGDTLGRMARLGVAISPRVIRTLGLAAA